jgi:hypothetical protein
MPAHRFTRRHALAALLAAFCAAFLVTGPGAVSALELPKGKVVLTIDGQISRTNAPQRADFDLDMLAALPQHVIRTHTPWHKGLQTFTGPLLRDVLAQAGASGQHLLAVALNDYRVELPMDDVKTFEVVLARLHNGEPMRVRDLGPLFIVYPFDSDERLRSDPYYRRSAWQLRSLTVR